MSITLCIAYAMEFCTEEQVREVFGNLIGEKNILSINMLQKKNDQTGQPFKMFFIEFSPNDALDELIHDIDTDPNQDPKKRHSRVQYDSRGHFWKVSRAFKKEVEFVPRILKRDEEKEMDPLDEALALTEITPRNGW